MINRRHTKLSDLVSISVLQIGSKSRPSLGHSAGKSALARISYHLQPVFYWAGGGKIHTLYFHWRDLYQGRGLLKFLKDHV